MSMNSYKDATSEQISKAKLSIQAGIGRSLLMNPYFLTVVLPVLLMWFYLGFWASERYESRAQLTVQSSEQSAAIDPSMMAMAALGSSGSNVQDAELVKAYVLSRDMLTQLQEELNLREIYSNSSIDMFSDMDKDASIEDFHAFYLAHVDVYVDVASGIITISAQAFDPPSARAITNTIVRFAEDYINSISRELGTAKLSFMREESERTLTQLRAAQERLIKFQNEYSLLDPEAEGLALQQITYSIESQITNKESELATLRAAMTANAPPVILVQSQVDALRDQLAAERARLVSTTSEESQSSANSMSVSEVIAKYADYKLDLELALQAYTLSQVSVESAQVETYRQAKYLVTLESPTEPQDNQYPLIIYNLSLMLVLLLLLNAIVRIVMATVRELG